MSSLTRRPNGHRWLCYKFKGKRHTLRLGAMGDANAADLKRRIDRLIEFRGAGLPIDAETTGWLMRLGDRFHRGLVTAGLLDARGPQTLAELCEAHDARLIAKGRKPSTITNARVLYRNVQTYFGGARRIDAITFDEADAFRQWMLAKGGKGDKPLELATVTNRCRRARGMFRYAIESGWLSANPFRELGQGSEANPERNAYITLDLFARVLDATDDPELRLLLAVCRFMGLRCPSEVQPLRWDNVADDVGILTVKSPKTQRYENQSQREVPIFAEMAPYFIAARDRCDGTGLLFPHHQASRAAVTDKLAALCRKIGEPLWPKPFVNLRASCEHDLFAAGHPINAIAAWMGHSPDTALRHYNRVVKEQQARSAAVALRLTPGPSKRRKTRSPVALRGGELRGVPGSKSG